jgi:hypothetical protein
VVNETGVSLVVTQGGFAWGLAPTTLIKRKSNFSNIQYKGLEQLQSHTVYD